MASLSFEHETTLGGRVCGVDEAGRGALAGDVFAAAVILSPTQIPNGLNDSKKLTAAQRHALALQLWQVAEIGVGIATAAEIDEINILQATMLAMQRAVAALPSPPTYALIDGNKAPLLPCPTTCIIKGDASVLSIAAASIIAKVARDEAMCALHHQLPHYGFNRHAGYGTAYHLAALREHGASAQHRHSFRPVRECRTVHSVYDCV
jgi:ribonuclease HII